MSTDDKLWFQEETVEEYECFDGRNRVAGGFRIPGSMVSLFEDLEVDFERLPNEGVSERDVYVGQVVYFQLTEYGRVHKPYLVVEREPHEEYENRETVVCKSICREDTEHLETIVLSPSSEYGSVGAGYKDMEFEGSRYVTGDGFSLLLVPDIILAKHISDDVVSQIMPVLL